MPSAAESQLENLNRLLTELSSKLQAVYTSGQARTLSTEKLISMEQTYAGLLKDQLLLVERINAERAKLSTPGVGNVINRPAGAVILLVDLLLHK